MYIYGTSLCVIKKPRKRGGYSPAIGLHNTNPQWVVAPVEKKYNPPLVFTNHTYKFDVILTVHRR